MHRFTNFDEEIKRGNEKHTPHTPGTQEPKHDPSKPPTPKPEQERY